MATHAPMWQPREHECGCGRREDTRSVEVVRAVELDGAVQLEDDIAARDRQKIDPHEVGADARGGLYSESASLARRPRRSSRPAERDIRPPLTWARDTLDRSDDLSGRDHKSQIAADRRHEFLDQGTVLREPRSGADLLECSRDVKSCLAAVDIRAPASKPRLDDNGRPNSGRLAWRANVLRLRVRDAGFNQEPGGSKLVVRVQERVRSVDDANAVALELGQDLDARLHAVERSPEPQMTSLTPDLHLTSPLSARASSSPSRSVLQRFVVGRGEASLSSSPGGTKRRAPNAST